MPNSLRVKLSKLRHKRKITNEEYQELIKKLDGHDAEVIKKFINNVLTELNGIAEDNEYYFDKDNVNFVSTIMYGQLEVLKEQEGE